MTPRQFLVGSDRFGLSAKSSSAKYRVALATAGLAVVAFVAWRWAASGASSSPRGLEITVLDVHDVAAPTRAVPPAAVAPAPAAAPVAPVTIERDPPPAAEPEPRTVAASPRPAAPAPTRSTPSSRSAIRTPPSRSSASRPAVAAKPVAGEESRVETPAARPTPPRPDSPPLETNPYVYK